MLMLTLLCLSGCAERRPHRLVTKPPDSQLSVFFVATNGNDRWSGRLPSPNPSRTDGPLATLPRALKAVRDLRGQIATGGGDATTAPSTAIELSNESEGKRGTLPLLPPREERG